VIPGPQPSPMDTVLEALGTIWSPGAAALKLQQSMNIMSLEDLMVATERAGYEICEVDLPESVGGFALTIGGKPQIVVNRDKSAEYRQYTVAHELGHHFLHLTPSPVPNSLLAVSGEMKEFQADAFASSLIVWLTPKKDRDEMLRQNPEFASAITIPILLSIGVILVVVLAHVWFQIFSDKSVSEDRR
jgi:Zn-dependent peptidase ImmA (M78 family)